MSLLTSLYSGTSGLRANSQDLSVIGDNIANVNTIGFKASRATFEDALSQTLIGGATVNGRGQLGLGTRLQVIQRLVTQGALMNTGLATDLALEGNGLFVVKGNHNGATGQYYTRAGQFTIDQDGYLINLEGLRVQGYSANGQGGITGTLGDLDIGDASSSPMASATVTIKANLQSDAVIPANPWDPADAAATSNFSTSTTVYDSLGKAHQVDIYYRKTGAGAWEWHALTDGGGVQGGTAGVKSEIATGTLTFDAKGALTAQTQTSNFNPVDAVQPQPLTFNFGTPVGGIATGLDGVTQFASPSATTFINQDGYAAGTLANVQIDKDGKVIGAFTNGESRALGQVAVANFAAPDQLERIGGNLYTQMPNSGQPNIGAAATGGRGSIVAGALEQSNVDLAEEFVRMIAAQRGYQANGKTITTADALLAELMTMKR